MSGFVLRLRLRLISLVQLFVGLCFGFELADVLLEVLRVEFVEKSGMRQSWSHFLASLVIESMASVGPCLRLRLQAHLRAAKARVSSASIQSNVAIQVDRDISSRRHEAETNFSTQRMAGMDFG